MLRKKSQFDSLFFGKPRKLTFSVVKKSGVGIEPQCITKTENRADSVLSTEKVSFRGFPKNSESNWDSFRRTMKEGCKIHLVLCGDHGGTCISYPLGSPKVRYSATFQSDAILKEKMKR